MARACSRKVVWVVFLFFLLLIVGGLVYAANGKQNDAGSGEDAGGDMQHACRIDSGVSYQGFLATNDLDYYSFDVSAGQIISVTLTSDVEMLMKVYDQNGHSIESVTATPGSPGKFEYVAGGTGTWMVKIHGYWTGNYTIRVDTTDQNDAGSGGDVGDDPEHAYHIDLGTTYQGFVKCADVSDYYSFDVNAGQIITITVTSSDNPLQVEVFGCCGVAHVSPDNPWKFEYVAGSNETWIINFYAYSGGSNYTVRVDASNQNDAGSGGDAGNNAQNACHIHPGVSYQGSLKDDDVSDYYSFDVGAGQIISVSLSAAAVTSGAEFIVELDDPDGDSKGCACMSQDSPGKIEHVAGSTGTWIIRVTSDPCCTDCMCGGGGGEGNYRLRVDIADQNDAGSGGDAGNDAEHAYPIDPGTAYRGFLEADDGYDYYSFEASVDQIISVSLSATPEMMPNAGYSWTSGPSFRVVLYAPDGAFKGSASSKQGSPGKVERVAGSTGTWRIGVESDYMERGDYTVRVDIADQNDAGSGGDAGDDREHAYHINPGIAYRGLVERDDRYDYYSFEAGAGQIIFLSLTSDSGSLKAIVYGPDGRWEAGVGTREGKSSDGVEYVAESAGTRIIMIDGGYHGWGYTIMLDYQVLSPRFTYSHQKEIYYPEGDEAGVFVGEVIRLDASSSSCKIGEIKGYKWLILNEELGYRESLTGRAVEWTSPCWGGTYTVKLTVTDEYGVSRSITDTIQVDLPPNRVCAGDILYHPPLYSDYDSIINALQGLGERKFEIISPITGHVGIVACDGTVIEAVGSGVRRLDSVAEFIHHYRNSTITTVYALRVTGVSALVRKKAVEFAEEQVGKAYNLPSLISCLLYPLVPQTCKQLFGDRYYCSELIWAAYEVASGAKKGKLVDDYGTVDLDVSDGPIKTIKKTNIVKTNIVLPAEIYYSPLTEVITTWGARTYEGE